jgi:xanthine dehydrogenase accessory factor
VYVDKNILIFFEECRNKKEDIALTFVESTTGSTFAKKGNIMLVNSNQEFTGVLGSNFLQEKIKENSKKALDTKQIQDFSSIPKDPSSGHGNSKYKTVPFYFNNNYSGIEKYIKRPFSLLIFGSGAHITPLIKMANIMGWITTVIDINLKKEFVEQADNKFELKNLEKVLSFDFNSFDASVILSHNPKTDDTYLKALLNTNIQYIGLMGNKQNAKRKKIQFNLENEKRFFAPIGFDIGSYTPESIALSICSQIEANKNGKL